MKPAYLVVTALAAILAGCGGGSPDRPNQPATLVLDFTPNAVHAGIYTAIQRDYTGAEGVELHVEVPSSSTDSVKLLASGRAQFAILDIHDLALAREKGRDLVGVMALVERPLAAVLAQPRVRTPRQLEGQRVGVTGLPSDDAVLDSIVQGAGGDPSRVHRTTIGFQAVPALLSGRVAGATAFWNVEGLAFKRARPGARVFTVDQYGAPAYPELVLTVSRATLEDSPSLVRATVTALQRGYREVLADPESAVQTLVDRTEGLDRKTVAAQLDAVQPALQAPDGTIGTLDPARLRAWARWEATFHITRRPPDVTLAFEPRFARAGAKLAAQNSG